MNTKSRILEFSNKLNLINSNLTELINSDEYLLIKNFTYIKLTKVEVDKSISMIDELWKKYLSFNSLFEKINTINNQSFFLFDKDEKIQNLIKETKFEIEKINIPLEKRDLLEESILVTEVSLDDLIKVMISEFSQIKQIIFTIIDLDKINKEKINEINEKIIFYKNLLSENDNIEISNLKEEILKNPLTANKSFDLYLKIISKLEEKIKEENKLKLSLKSNIEEREIKFLNFKNYLDKKITEISLNEKLTNTNTNELNYFEINRLNTILNEVLKNNETIEIYKILKVWDNDFLLLCKIEHEKLLNIYNLNLLFTELEGLFRALSVKFKLLNSKGLISENLFKLREEIKKIFQQNKIDIQMLQNYMSEYQKQLFVINSN